MPRPIISPRPREPHCVPSTVPTQWSRSSALSEHYVLCTPKHMCRGKGWLPHVTRRIHNYNCTSHRAAGCMVIGSCDLPCYRCGHAESRHQEVSSEQAHCKQHHPSVLKASNVFRRNLLHAPIIGACTTVDSTLKRTNMTLIRPETLTDSMRDDVTFTAARDCKHDMACTSYFATHRKFATHPSVLPSTVEDPSE